MKYEISTMSISEIAHALRLRQFTCEELAEYFLNRIKQFNTVLNAFIYVAEEDVLTQAKILDCELRAGIDRGLLHGIPISIKDNFHVKGMRTTAGSEYLVDSKVQTKDSKFVENLRSAGASILGKNNMSEFAVGFTSRNETFGSIKNPWNIEYTAGGSSGGTAAAVAGGLCVGGIGSDTGGSVRLPASVCGIVGIRPTRGLIELSSGIKRAISLDVAGPFAKNVDDASILLRAMYGRFRPYVELGSESKNNGSGIPQLSKRRDIELIDKVVVLVTFDEIENDVKHRMMEAASVLKMQGVSIRETPISVFDYILESDIISKLLFYEFYNHMLELAGEEITSMKLGEFVRNDLHKGSKITSTQYAHFLLERDQFIQDLNTLFQDVDAIIMPVLPTRTPFIDEKNEIFELARKFLMPASYMGWPAISVPYGCDEKGLPIGVQIVGSYYQEQTVLDLARLLEQNKQNLPISKHSTCFIQGKERLDSSILY